MLMLKLTVSSSISVTLSLLMLLSLSTTYLAVAHNAVSLAVRPYAEISFNFDFFFHMSFSDWAN